MKNKIENDLLEDEYVNFDTKISFIGLLLEKLTFFFKGKFRFYMTTSVLFTIPFYNNLLYLIIIFLMVLIIYSMIVSFFSTVTITNKRLFIYFGLFTKLEIEKDIKYVEKVKIEQGFFGDIFNYGNIQIIIKNSKFPYNVLAVKEPNEFRREVIDSKS